MWYPPRNATFLAPPVSAPSSRRYHCDPKNGDSLCVVTPERAGDLPASTLHRLRNTDYDDLVVLDYDLQETLSQVKDFARCRCADAVFGANLRVTQIVLGTVAGRSIPAALVPSKAKVTSTVSRAQTIVGLKRTLRLLRLFRHRYSRWWNQMERSCMTLSLTSSLESPPGQLSTTQASTIKKVTRDEL